MYYKNSSLFTIIFIRYLCYHLIIKYGNLIYYKYKLNF
jgi:hypothetical protein